MAPDPEQLDFEFWEGDEPRRPLSPRERLHTAWEIADEGVWDPALPRGRGVQKIESDLLN